MIERWVFSLSWLLWGRVLEPELEAVHVAAIALPLRSWQSALLSMSDLSLKPGITYT